jgi:hypothetical protein
MKQIAVVKIPGHKPEYLDVDPRTHTLYQNIADLAEIAVIDPASLKVVRTIKTPQLTKNHPLQYDAKYRVLIAGGKNGVLASYTVAGVLLSTTRITAAVDQCNLDAARQQIACAGDGELDVIRIENGGKLQAAASRRVPGPAHTLAYDTRTGNLWVVWSAAAGDAIQEFTVK